MTFKQVLRGRDYSDLHDGFCRCKACKPPHPTDRKVSVPMVLLGLGLLVLAIVVTI